MSYQSQWNLTYDDAFVSRCRAAITNQSAIFKDDQRADIKALAEQLLKGIEVSPLITFQNMLGAAPGFADMVNTGDGVDSSQITDGDILSAVQSMYPAVAALYYPSAP